MCFHMVLPLQCARDSVCKLAMRDCWLLPKMQLVSKVTLFYFVDVIKLRDESSVCEYIGRQVKEKMESRKEVNPYNTQHESTHRRSLCVPAVFSFVFQPTVACGKIGLTTC